MFNPQTLRLATVRWALKKIPSNPVNYNWGDLIMQLSKKKYQPMFLMYHMNPNQKISYTQYCNQIR